MQTLLLIMKLKHLYTITIAISFLAISCTQTESDFTSEASFNTMEDSVSYAIGFQNGERLSSQGFSDVDMANFIAGFNDGLTDEDDKLVNADMQELFNRFGTYLRDKVKLVNQEEEKTFFAANREKEGVIETASGLQYEVIEEGTGATPTPESTVVVHYEGTLLDGTAFDASYGGEPAEFLVGNVISGWIEALSLMKEGATYMFYIPAELGYGDYPRPGGVIQPGDALIFKLELIQVK